MATANGSHSDIHSVLVIGAVFPASAIIKALDNANLDVHVVHPRPPNSAYKQITHHECEATAKELTPVFRQVRPDVVISAVSGGKYDTQKEIIDAAVETGVSRFIPYEFGQDSLNKDVQERLPPSRAKGKIIEYLKDLAKEGKLSWVGVATGIDLDRGLLKGNLGFDIKWQSVTMHGQGHERFAASTGSWLGKVVVAVLQHWKDVENQYIYASGLTTSGDEVVAALEKATDADFMVSRGDVQECVREGKKRIEVGYPDAGMFLMGRSVMYDESIAAARPFEEDDAKKTLGLEAEKLDGIIEWVCHEMQHHDAGGCGCD